MGLIANLKLFNNVRKVLKEVQALKEANETEINEIKEIVESIIANVKKLATKIPSALNLAKNIKTIIDGLKK